jgi:hypothetical protein
MMDRPRVPLYERLPEIYRTRDEEIEPRGQLRAFLALIERAFSSIHADIESLHDDIFIETAADWAVHYIGDLLGTTSLAGDPWTIRADVASTIPLRRRKGTLAAIELLTFSLTKWGVRGVELRENLVWSQHLNHQRPDNGGLPAYGPPGPGRAAPIRGGTVTLRDPAILGLLGTPFDPFGHTPDVKPQSGTAIRYNLPNLAIFLWRLTAYQVPVVPPGSCIVQAVAGATGNEAAFLVRVEIHPLGRPVRLFNTRRNEAIKRMNPNDEVSLTMPDEAPGPILPARLTDDTIAGHPAAYVTVDTWDPAAGPDSISISETGLQLYVPNPDFTGASWQFRGANLCAWESGLDRPVDNREIAIDPVIGRLAIGVATQAEADALVANLLLTYTYGAVGPVGAHPVPRPPAPTQWADEPVHLIRVPGSNPAITLQDALANLDQAAQPTVIEIGDSRVHDLDLSTLAGTITEAGEPNLALNRTLIIRAASGMRPIIRLTGPLRVRPVTVTAANPADQAAIDRQIRVLTLRLEGLHLVRGPAFPANQPLIARAALNSLEIDGCTLDPGGYRLRDDTRAPVEPAIALETGHGFADPADEATFKETPMILLDRSISGALQIDPDYRIEIHDSIIDAGSGVADPAPTSHAISAATDPANAWGASLIFSGTTFFGRVRVETISGEGGIFVHAIQAHNNQTGCIKFSYFSGVDDRLPQNHACIDGSQAVLRFTDEWFSDPAYGQVALISDFRLRERGPADDLMGAFGFLLESHKWRNLQIRYREFMPLGVRPLLIPVT